jgi:FlaA1/EpsC-like NDP-sugar epimerase
VSDPASELRPVGFIDDDGAKDGRLVNGIPIVGTMVTLERVIRRFAVQTVIIATDSLPRAASLNSTTCVRAAPSR